MSDKQYNPISCEHKKPNGLTAWNWFSEEQGSGPELDYKVNIAVCMNCGEIRVSGWRWDGGSAHKDHFNEILHIYHPDAIDAIIKQANYFNEEAKWGRVNPSENGGGAVWVKASERIPEGHAADYHWRFTHSRKPIVCVFHIAINTLVMEYNNTRARFNFSDVEWLDESAADAGSGKEEVDFAEWCRNNYQQAAGGWRTWPVDPEEFFTDEQLYDIFKKQNK